MENLICNLCAGSPDIDLYIIERNDEQRWLTGQSKNTIRVDICIGKEISMLIDNGVLTKNCCCGHGERKPSCLVLKSSKEILDELNYKYREFNNGLLEVELKTAVQCELRKVLSGKVFRYIEK